MNYWMSRSVTDVESFILNRATVTQLDDFVLHHSQYLVSISTDPQKASECWNLQHDKIHPGEGWISLRLNGEEIMPLEAWTNIALFWESVLELTANYLRTGQGSGEFSDESAQFSLTRKTEGIAVFSLRGTTHIVNPQAFLTSLLTGADAFYEWAEQYVGTFPAAYRKQVASLLRSLRYA